MKYTLLAVLMLVGCAQQGGSRPEDEAFKSLGNALQNAGAVYDPALMGGSVQRNIDYVCMTDCTKRYSYAYCQRVCEY